MEDRDPFDVQADGFMRGAGLFLEPSSGAYLGLCVESAIEIAKRHGRKVVFLFNDTPVVVVRDSDLIDTLKKFDKAREARR